MIIDSGQLKFISQALDGNIMDSRGADEMDGLRDMNYEELLCMQIVGISVFQSIMSNRPTA